jgi:hypothetical protein
VGDDPQTGRPNTVEPALALADLGLQPGLVAINAPLRAKALECSTLPHEAELAMAVGATIVHGFPSNGASVEPTRLRTGMMTFELIVQCNIVYCNAQLV